MFSLAQRIPKLSATASWPSCAKPKTPASPSLPLPTRHGDLGRPQLLRCWPVRHLRCGPRFTALAGRSDSRRSRVYGRGGAVLQDGLRGPLLGDAVRVLAHTGPLLTLSLVLRISIEIASPFLASVVPKLLLQPLFVHIASRSSSLSPRISTAGLLR